MELRSSLKLLKFVANNVTVSKSNQLKKYVFEICQATHEKMQHQESWVKDAA
ncbi:MAG: hypothetical protein Q7S97_01650 [Polaromonas sp.]|nr:hypothetical protein [Polaromonas sp.]